MGVIFDTSVLISLERLSVNLETLTRGREGEPFGICAITVSELLHGVHRADSEKRRLQREAYVEKMIETFPVYAFDVNAARIYARLWANLAKKEIHIGSHDLMIASTAVSMGFSVVTHDRRDYEKINGLKVETLSQGR